MMMGQSNLGMSGMRMQEQPSYRQSQMNVSNRNMYYNDDYLGDEL